MILKSVVELPPTGEGRGAFRITEEDVRGVERVYDDPYTTEEQRAQMIRVFKMRMNDLPDDE